MCPLFELTHGRQRTRVPSASSRSNALANETTPLVIVFAEGDSYVWHCDTGEWEDNGEWSSGEDARNLPGYEEWYEIGLLVIKTIVPGPNKDPRYRYIDISRKHMPCRVTAGDTVLYEE